MTIQNKYYYRSRISEAKFRQLIRYFSMDFTATDAAILTNISVRSVNLIYLKIRVKLAEICEQSSPLSGAIKVDESYFGAQNAGVELVVKRLIVFGHLKREGKVYTEIVSSCSKSTLQDIIRGKIDPKSVIHSDGWRGYDGLVDLAYDKHFRVHHGANEFVREESHINGIENFWNYAKRRLVKFNGVPKKTFYLHLKETEFRFNHRHDNLYLEILKILRNNPL